MSQKQLIKKHLQRGWSITPLQALNKYGCLRLAAYIHRLKKEGLAIEDISKERYSRYKLY
jgi:hypothetical protein